MSGILRVPSDDAGEEVVAPADHVRDHEQHGGDDERHDVVDRNDQNALRRRHNVLNKRAKFASCNFV